MEKRFAYYQVNRPLNEVYQETLTFWARNNGFIKSKMDSANLLVRGLYVDRNTEGSVERYYMNMGFAPDQGVSYISVVASLVRGPKSYLKALQNLLDEWANQIKAPSVILKKNPDRTFERLFVQLKRIAPPPSRPQSMHFSRKTTILLCPYCGGKNRDDAHFCVSCGTKIV